MTGRVFLSSSSHLEGAAPLSFEKCCLTAMGCSGHQTDAGFLYKNERLLLYPSYQGVRLVHPPGCPCRFLTTSDIANIPENNLSRGVKPAVAVLLQSSDGYVLLTRRAQHMRTFPCVWVPPGGHMEPGETLKQALLRELSEETGLTFSEESLEILTLGLWESVFPPVLSIGLPVRHHIVVYHLAQAKEDRQTLQEGLILNKDELDASAWVDHATIMEVVQSDDFGQLRPVPQRYIKATVLENGQKVEKNLPLSILMSTMPRTSEDEQELNQERLSTGTKFALEQLVKKDLSLGGAKSPPGGAW